MMPLKGYKKRRGMTASSSNIGFRKQNHCAKPNTAIMEQVVDSVASLVSSNRS
ncbi:hypothetical protein KIN20_007405 [Parelaphostrongylus tenuis]|uniref:Uncharacterized protein n=1 Tax=Parelaphostrongylus tenuis TaxID=148309 RepID=A0AAD5MPN2_PARTN|nr:hypothetical protein KIN20_007405 [Parelaphostrongylus tenuis]